MKISVYIFEDQTKKNFEKLVLGGGGWNCDLSWLGILIKCFFWWEVVFFFFLGSKRGDARFLWLNECKIRGGGICWKKKFEIVNWKFILLFILKWKMKLHVIASILIDPEIKVQAGRIVLFWFGQATFLSDQAPKSKRKFKIV